MKKFIITRPAVAKTICRRGVQTKAVESCPGTKDDDGGNGGKEAEIRRLFAILTDPSVSISDKLQVRIKLDSLLELIP